MRYLFAAVFLILCFQESRAQRNQISFTLSNRVGDTLEPHEREYFKLFAYYEHFNGAWFTKTGASTYTITVEADGKINVYTLPQERVDALRQYIDNFEARYTGQQAHQWEHIGSLARAITEPYGIPGRYKLTLINGQKVEGKLAYADETGIFIAKHLSKESARQTAANVKFIPTNQIYRLEAKPFFIKRLFRAMDVYNAGEERTYLSVILPELRNHMFYSRALPPEIHDKRGLLQAPYAGQPSTDWATVRAQEQDAKLHFSVYFSPTPFLYLRAPYPVQTTLEVSPDAPPLGTSIDIEIPAYYVVARMNTGPRFQIGASTFSTRKFRSGASLDGVPITGPDTGFEAARISRAPGQVRVNGQFYNLDFSYLLTTLRNYTVIYPAVPVKKKNVELKITAGPGLARINTISYTEAARFGARDGFTAFRFGTSVTKAEVLWGGHVAMEMNLMVSKFLSFGLLLDTSVYTGLDAEDHQLFELPAPASNKFLTGFNNKLLWVSSFYIGATVHL
ncbi:MAG: hypothetical protein AAF564_14895 [Bacteroidota bacterium]